MFVNGDDMDISIRVAGEAGQGVQSAGNLLVGALASAGFHVFTAKSYMSRIRGGLNWFDIRISNRELFAPKEKADLLVALTREAFEILGRETSDGLILLDSHEAQGAYAIPFTQTAKEIGNAIMANSVAAGAVLAVLGLDNKHLMEYLRKQFHDKPAEVVEQNIAAAGAGEKLAQSCAGRLPAAPEGAWDSVYAGADAIGLGAATAGVKFVTAYPMTPSTATLNFLAESADRYGILVEQAEDEIAAINMVCGSTYAGAPSLTVTSGGGFALMVEGISLAGMLELPVVILLAQRPGPATGLPTRTAQGDLNMAIHAGHGEFPKMVFAPGTHQECYAITRHAVMMAHKYQTPVIILTDQFLQDAEKNIRPLSEELKPVDCFLSAGGREYARYALSPDGISPRAVPGGEALVVVDSDEHDQCGHISEDLAHDHLPQHDKRMRKMIGLTAESFAPSILGPPGAPNLMICWGSSYGPCREAVEMLNADDNIWTLLHFSQVWPLNEDAARQAIGERSRVIIVEGNSTAQFASLLRQLGLVGPCEACLRYDGLPLTADYVVDKVSKPGNSGAA
jgi:2-oxoglutarate ferredoxin oxidoreductase subunit alpha